MMEIAVIQGLFMVYAILFAHFQIPVLKAFTDYVPINNPYNKSFHRRGALLSATLALILVSLYAGFQLYTGLYWVKLCVISFIAGIQLYAWYQLLFDGYIGLVRYKNLFYLGTTSEHDNFLHKVFPHGDAGEIKFFFCLAYLIISNILLTWLQ